MITLPTEPGSQVVSLESTTLETNHLVEELNGEAVDTCDRWAAFQQLPSETSLSSQNHDMDGRTNAEEWYFGCSPFVADPPLIPTLAVFQTDSSLQAELTFNRSAFASGLDPDIQTFSNLRTFTPLLSFPYEVSTRPDGSDILTATIPLNGDSQRFFIVQPPVQDASNPTGGH